MTSIEILTELYKLKGENHPCWKGGKYKDNNGYIKIRKLNHPKSDGHGYILEHRLVYEEYYNCCLLDWILIHHKNEIKTDNRIENLEPITRQKHAILHITKDMSNRFCLNCKSKKTYKKCWHKYLNGFLCENCYCRNKRKKYKKKNLF